MVLYVRFMRVKKAIQACINFLKTDKFFYCIAGLFFISSIWLVFTARYPMAFDENYHVGIIQQYAKQWSPFFANPPIGSEALGDITRYPSYLFHYVMSFPYRLVYGLTSSETITIVVLRLMNVAMLGSSLWVFKALFRKMKFSKLLGNLSLFVFVMIPIVPFLGAQISYDNVTIPLTALTLLATVHVLVGLKKGIFSSNWLMAFLITGMFTALVKYTYLPIFVGLFVYLVIAFVWSYKKYRFSVLSTVQKNYLNLSAAKKLVLAVGLILGIVLCLERYGINMVRYHNPVPDCGQILSQESCNQYGPWARDLRLKQRKHGNTPSWKISDYNKVWVGTTLNEFYFAINYDYHNEPPLRVLYEFAKITLVVGLISVAIFIKRILKNSGLRLILFISVFYTLILWVDNYMKFYHVHWPVAIHGRYLLPLVPAMAILMGYGIFYTLELLPRTVRRSVQYTAIFVLLFGVSFGGGTLTYIARSDSNWYWQNSFVTQINTKVKQVLITVLK